MRVMQNQNIPCNSEPFAHGISEDFYDHWKELRDDVLNEVFVLKQSDLFSFSQTQDLGQSKKRAIQAFRSFMLSEEVRNKFEQVLDVSIKKDKLDLFGSIYQDTDHLLCHDDQLDSRVVAFMLYLSDIEKGGALCLFSSKDDKPVEIVKKINPKVNRLVFFKVGKTSFHEVEEVETEKPRVAIGGWYHRSE